MNARRVAARRRARRGSWWPYGRRRRSTIVRARQARIGSPYEGRGTLLTKGEAAFFGPLQEAVGHVFQVMCKVRVADILTCSDADWRRGFGAAISQKHLDFVLCEPRTTRIILAIELDDRSHELKCRQQRDRFLNQTLRAAGIRLLRVKARARYSSDIIRRLVFACLRSAAPEFSRQEPESLYPGTAP
ncbi:MAG: hypothetical protein DCC65_07920 [Planctomycetota bacterium]|nr:MAG: hypothetical protein DCC65_07920 [Planctomycetota bacterium]